MVTKVGEGVDGDDPGAGAPLSPGVFLASAWCQAFDRHPSFEFLEELGCSVMLASCTRPDMMMADWVLALGPTDGSPQRCKSKSTVARIGAELGKESFRCLNQACPRHPLASSHGAWSNLLARLLWPKRASRYPTVNTDLAPRSCDAAAAKYSRSRGSTTNTAARPFAIPRLRQQCPSSAPRQSRR